MEKIKDLVIQKLKEIDEEIINEKELDENENMIATPDSIIVVKFYLLLINKRIKKMFRL